MKEQTQNKQLEMFGDPNAEKRIAELEEELKNLKAAYDRLALMYQQETTPTMTTHAKPGEALYTDEVLENGQRKRVPRRKLEDWEEAGVAREHFTGWDN